MRGRGWHLEGDAAADVHGVDDVAEALAHLATVGVANDGMEEHFLEVSAERKRKK